MNWEKLQQKKGNAPGQASKPVKASTTAPQKHTHQALKVNIAPPAVAPPAVAPPVVAPPAVAAKKSAPPPKIANDTKFPPLDKNAPSKLLSKTGKFIALDCEMVGVGKNGTKSNLARASIVNYHGHVILDTYVRPREPVTDYRAAITGIGKKHLEKGREFSSVQGQVDQLIRNRILVGHALHHDLKVLELSHSPKLTRDTSKHIGLRTKENLNSTPSLKKLAYDELGMDIQNASHSSVEDARVAMLLYKKVKVEWEQSLNEKKKM